MPPDASSSGVPTYSIGTGACLIVVHGGPGFSYHYLMAPLSPLAAHRRLVFSPQPGHCENPDRKHAATLAGSMEQLTDLIEHFGRDGPCTILAHSWGALVVMSALASPIWAPTLAKHLKNAILINPLPLTRIGLDQVSARFRSRFSFAEKLLVLVQSRRSGGADRIMALLLRHYGIEPDEALTESFALDLSCYRRTMASVGDYELSIGEGLWRRIVVIHGERDVTSLSSLDAIRCRCQEFVELKDAGHFPMLDRPDKLMPVLERVLLRS